MGTALSEQRAPSNEQRATSYELRAGSGGREPMMSREVPGVSRRFYTGHETDEPAPCSIHLGSDLWTRLHHSESDSELDLALQLTCRPNRDPQESRQLFLGSSARTLGDVRADRYDGRSHLSYQPESFPRWKSLRQAIDGRPECDAVSPNIEPPEITHPYLSNRPRRRAEPLCGQTRSSQLVARCSSLVARRSLLVARCSSLVARCSLGIGP